MGIYSSKPQQSKDDSTLPTSDKSETTACTAETLKTPEKGDAPVLHVPKEMTTREETTIDQEVGEVSKKASEDLGCFIDPRSPSANVHRTPVQTAPTSKSELTEPQTIRPDTDPTTPQPLREKRSIGNVAADNLRRRAIMKQRDATPLAIATNEKENVDDSDNDQENMSPAAERTPIPSSPKKRSDMSILADDLANMGLQTPVAIKPMASPTVE